MSKELLDREFMDDPKLIRTGEGLLLKDMVAPENVYPPTDRRWILGKPLLPTETVVEDMVNHPKHYGGADDPMEVIKIAEHYDLDRYDFNLLKYLLRKGKKEGNSELQELKKALWYLTRKIWWIESKNK